MFHFKMQRVLRGWALIKHFLFCHKQHTGVLYTHLCQDKLSIGSAVHGVIKLTGSISNPFLVKAHNKANS